MCANISFSSFQIILAALQFMSVKTDYVALNISSFFSHKCREQEIICECLFIHRM